MIRDNMDALIKLENVSFKYPTDESYESPFAVNNVSLKIKEGEFVAILGHNGSGKSTLLKILTGVINQTSGEKKMSGSVSALLELGTGFNPEYSGIENIYLNGTIMGIPREEMEEKRLG